MQRKSLSTPILLLIFNRPDTTRQVLDQIRQVRPKRLFVAADGPRKDKKDDVTKCQEARNVVMQGIDWECDIKTLFSDKNLGCGRAPATSISWFFDNVVEGIILEDDILPSISFFYFCEELLIKYRNVDQVMSIGGTNFLNTATNCSNSYMFSKYAGNWGWASWARAWEGYDYNISTWKNVETQVLFKKNFSQEQYQFFYQVFEAVFNKNVDDIWDYQWWYHRLVNNALDITPKLNLTKNIGFNSDATHTFEVSNDIRLLENHEVKFPLVHPLKQEINTKYDKELSDKYYTVKVTTKPSFLQRVLNRF